MLTFKVHRHIAAFWGTFSTPDARFDHIHLDFMDPLLLMVIHTLWRNSLHISRRKKKMQERRRQNN